MKDKKRIKSVASESPNENKISDVAGQSPNSAQNDLSTNTETTQTESHVRCTAMVRRLASELGIKLKVIEGHIYQEGAGQIIPHWPKAKFLVIDEDAS